MRYIVKQIIEPDFGCEGRPEGYVIMDTVRLRNENGQEIDMVISDSELYEKNINEGDWVYFDLNDQVFKET